MSLKRRDFLKMVGGLTVWSAIPACADADEKKLLKNENKPPRSILQFPSEL